MIAMKAVATVPNAKAWETKVLIYLFSKVYNSKNSCIFPADTNLPIAMPALIFTPEAPTRSSPTAYWWEAVRQAYDSAGVDWSELARELLCDISFGLTPETPLDMNEFISKVSTYLAQDLYSQGEEAADRVLKELRGRQDSNWEWVKDLAETVQEWLETDEAFNPPAY